jgi:molecular chaperone GrpE
MTTNKSHRHEAEVVAENAAASAKAEKAKADTKARKAAAKAGKAAEKAAAKAAGKSSAKDSGQSGEPSEVETLLAQLAEERERALRAQAEFENVKRRHQAQQAQALLRASERVITALIPVMDDLEMGIVHATDTGNDMADGMQAISAKMAGVFAAEGVQTIDPITQPFDHNTAQAVQMIEDDSKPDQTVVQVLQKGYVMAADSDTPRVLRPAMVIVSTNNAS